MADPDVIGQRELGRFSVAVFDELIALSAEHRKLDQAAFGVQDAKLVVLVKRNGRAVRAALDANARPGDQFVGYLIDERGNISHEHDPTKPVESRSF